MRIKLKYCLSMVFCLYLISNSNGQVSNSTEYLVAGDAVRIQIWDKPGETSGNNLISQVNDSYAIGTTGTIVLPFVGPVFVAGKSTKEVEQIILNKYSAFLKEPFIYIRPLIRITLSGGIARPGSYRIDPKSSLWDLFDLAGGVTSNADLEKIAVVRGGERVIENLLSAFEKAYSLQDVGVQSGDQIRIQLRSGFSLQQLVAWVNLGLTLAWVYLQIMERR